MNAQYSDRLKNACRFRRSRFHAALLSSAMLASPTVYLVSATDSTERRPVWQATENASSSVLKSVGIKFVTDSTAAEKPAAEKPAVSNVESSEPQSVSTVIVNALAPAPTIKMPPLTTGPTPHQALMAPKKVEAVKIEMSQVTNSIGKLEALPALPIASEKSSEPKSLLAETAKLPQPSLLPILTAVEKLQPISQEPNKNAPLDTPPSDTALSITIPNVPSPSMDAQESPAATLMAPAKIASIPTLANKRAIAEDSRSPHIVRIPSMTLTSKSLEKAETTPPPEIVPPKAAPLISELAEAPLPVQPVRKSEPLPDSSPLAPIEKQEIKPKAQNVNSLLANNSGHTKSKLTDITSDQGLASKRSAQPALTVVAIPVSLPSTANDQNYEISSAIRTNIADAQTDDEVRTEPSVQNVELVYRDVQSLQLVGVIEKVLVDDETVCKAMISESKEIMLLGVGQGKTRVKVVMASKDSSVPNIHFINATVREAWSTTSPQQVSTFAKATQSISELFPTARIAIRTNENGSLTLFGRTDSEEQAKQIASLVRKMFLVPIQDRIAVATTR